jgi:hypothetical protein
VQNFQPVGAENMGAEEDVFDDGKMHQDMGNEQDAEDVSQDRQEIDSDMTADDNSTDIETLNNTPSSERNYDRNNQNSNFGRNTAPTDRGKEIPGDARSNKERARGDETGVFLSAADKQRSATAVFAAAFGVVALFL